MFKSILNSLKNLKIFTKLIIIGGIITIPIIVLLFLLILEKNISIDFAQKEIYGNTHLKSLRKLVESIPEHKLITQKYLSNKSEKDNLILKEIQIDKYFNELDVIDKNLSEYIETGKKLATLKSEWDSLKNQIEGISVVESNDAHFNLFTQLRSLISHVGDKSNLILDPDLDSYYTMDSVLIKLPDSEDLLNQIIFFGKDIIEKKSLSADEKTRLIVLTGLFSSDIDGINYDMEVAFKNNPSGNLKPAIESQLNQTVKISKEFLNLIDEKLIKAEKIDINTDDFILEANKVLKQHFKLGDLQINELDKLLQIRINGFNKKKFTSIVFVLSVLILAAYSGFILSMDNIKSLKALESAAKSVSQGKLDVKVNIDSKDEIGILCQHFNVMVNNIKQLMAEVVSEKEELQQKEHKLQEALITHEKLTEEIQIEKLSVERKVEEAILYSETQKEYLSKSVKEMLLVMEKFANGDLTVKLISSDNNEIGKLYNGFNKAVSNICKMFQGVVNSFNLTNKTISNISSSIEQLASGAQEQSCQATEISASVEEFTIITFDNAKNAKNAVNKAIDNGNVAEQGGKVVTETINKMKQIASVVNNSVNTVKKLNNSSSKIGEIVSVIDEIASQTNLLALNASIEAARAGEHGRGFGVVADGVRKLAERTAVATKEISQMIKEIQIETRNVISSIGEGTSEVNEGIKLSDKTGEFLKNIVVGANGTVEMLNIIAISSEEQAKASEQVSQNVMTISHVANDTSELVYKISQSVENLNKLVNNLNSSVKEFKINMD